MKLRVTPQAARDLRGIAEYIRAENPGAAERVRAAILDSLHILTEFPHIGRRQTTEGVRKHVTRKYGYLIYYTLDPRPGEVTILSIQHPARDRPFHDR